MTSARLLMRPVRRATLLPPSRFSSTSSSSSRDSPWSRAAPPPPPRRTKPAWFVELEGRQSHLSRAIEEGTESALQRRRREALEGMLRRTVAGFAGGAEREVRPRELLEHERKVEDALRAEVRVAEVIAEASAAPPEPVPSATKVPPTTANAAPTTGSAAQDPTLEGAYRPFPDAPPIPLDQVVLFRSTINWRLPPTLQFAFMIGVPTICLVYLPLISTLGFSGVVLRLAYGAVIGMGVLNTYIFYRNIFRTVSYTTVPRGTTFLSPSTPLTLYSNAHRVKLVGHSFLPSTFPAGTLHVQGRLTSRKREDDKGARQIDARVRISPVAKPYWFLYGKNGRWAEGLESLSETEAKAEIEDTFQQGDDVLKRDFVQFQLSEGLMHNINVFLTRTAMKIPFVGKWLARQP